MALQRAVGPNLTTSDACIALARVGKVKEVTLTVHATSRRHQGVGRFMFATSAVTWAVSKSPHTISGEKLWATTEEALTMEILGRLSLEPRRR